jgi:hypothetical protein
MSEVVSSSGGEPYGIVVTSSSVRYILVKNSGYLEMWKNSGSGWSNVGTNQYYTTVHGTGATAIGYPGCGIDSNDIIHVADINANTNGTMDLSYATFDPSSDSWSSWTEIGQWTGGPYTYNRGTNVILDSNDKVWVGWGETDSVGDEVCYVSTNVTGSWATTEISAGYATERNLYIGADSSDNIHAFWYDYTNIGWSYRKYTPGSGWGTIQPLSTGSRRYLYDSNVVHFGSYILALAATSGNVYYKDQTGQAYSATFTHDTAYDWVFHTVSSDNMMHAVTTVISGSYNVLRIMEWTGPFGGTAYSTAETVTDNTANVTRFCVAHDELYKNYNGVEIAYERSGNVYYHQYSWSEPASDSQIAFLQGPFAYTTDDQQAAVAIGGIETSSSQAAYLDFEPIRTSVGGAWMNGYSTEVQRSSQSVYLFADMNENAQAYTEGEGLWPFSYDWSGNDNDTWDPMYWVTDDS